MRSPIIAATFAVLLAALCCSCATEASTTPAATSTPLAAIYCRGVEHTGAVYYARRLGGECLTASEQRISLGEFEGLSLSRQCTLAGSTSFYGLIGDPDSLDFALATCIEAGGVQDPGAK